MVLKSTPPKEGSPSELRCGKAYGYAPLLSQTLFKRYYTVLLSEIKYLKTEWHLTYRYKSHIILQRQFGLPEQIIKTQMDRHLHA